MSIYQYKTSDGYKVILLFFLVFNFLYSSMDFVAAIALFDDPSLIWYIFFPRIIVMMIYMLLSIRAYYYYQYFGLFFILIGIPTILWAILAFYILMNALLFSITMLIYIYIGWLFFSYNNARKFDYTEAAMKLIKNYPQKRINVMANNVLLLSEIDSNKNFSEILAIKLLSFIPPWFVFTVPLIAINIISSYIGFNGLVIGTVSTALFLCLMLSTYLSVHFRYIYVFKEAEKILSGREKENKLL